jgi:hypothetical protein
MEGFVWKIIKKFSSSDEMESKVVIKEFFPTMVEFFGDDFHDKEIDSIVSNTIFEIIL